jgi:hypothetical protein
MQALAICCNYPHNTEQTTRSRKLCSYYTWSPNSRRFGVANDRGFAIEKFATGAVSRCESLVQAEFGNGSPFSCSSANWRLRRRGINVSDSFYFFVAK